jgi:hypothetical protein
LFKNLKRIGFDLGIVLLILLSILFLPHLNVEGKINFLASLAMVAVRVSMGIMVAHITRKLMWPYIHFKDEKEWSNNLMVIAWYVVIIWSFARGG